MRILRRTPRGFTLTELLVVISILGVIAGTVVIAVQGFSGEADSTACRTDERAVIDAEEVHHAQTGDYVDEAGLVAAGHLKRASTNHDVELTVDGYNVIGIGNCAPVEEAAGDDAGDLSAKQSQAASAFETGAGATSSFAEGWFAIGAAEISGGVAVLTPGKEASTGAAIFGTPLPSDGLKATFAAWSGQGGEGLAFVLLDADADPKSPGTGGAGLGFAGLPAYAVAIDTVQSSKSDPSAPFVGIADGHDGLEYLATAPAPGLEESWHEITVEVQGSTIVVSVDGATVLKQEVKLPPEVRVGFTGSTGDTPAQQVVAKVQISS